MIRKNNLRKMSIKKKKVLPKVKMYGLEKFSL